MANKVRVTALFLVLAILIATFGAVSVVQAKTVGDVEKLEIIEEGQQTGLHPALAPGQGRRWVSDFSIRKR